MASMRAYDRLQESAVQEKWKPARMRAMPQCHATLHRQESTLRSSRCVGNHSFGCIVFEGSHHMWIAHGCRGVFRCAGDRQRCGRAGLNNERLNICRCEGEAGDPLGLGLA